MGGGGGGLVKNKLPKKNHQTLVVIPLIQQAEPEFQREDLIISESLHVLITEKTLTGEDHAHSSE